MNQIFETRRDDSAVRSLHLLQRLIMQGRESEARTVLSTVRADRGRPLVASEEVVILEHLLQNRPAPEIR